jgi:major membrane immunogen (membrane-anchored lipoprotein)
MSLLTLKVGAGGLSPTAIAILSALTAQGTPADSTMQAWIVSALAATGSTNYLVLKNTGQLIGLNLQTSASAEGWINWGDGTDTTLTPGTYEYKGKDYGSTGDRGVVIIGNVTRLNSDYNDGRTAFGGDISTILSMTDLVITGSNTVSGSIAGLTSLTFLVITGSNTVSGSIAGLTSLTYLALYGYNTVTYNTSSGRVWPAGTRYIYVSPGSAGVWTSEMTDAILIDSSGTTWSSEKSIDLQGYCGGRTSASDAAVLILTGLGVSVLTN